MVKKAVEQTGLIPRSIIRTFDRFRKQLFPEAKKLVIQEFRISRYQFLVSIKCFASLIFIPLIVNFLLKNFLLIPLTENLWNNQQSDIFLNSYQQEQAFIELRKFQEKLYFEYLLNDETLNQIPNLQDNVSNTLHSKQNINIKQYSSKIVNKPFYLLYEQKNFNKEALHPGGLSCFKLIFSKLAALGLYPEGTAPLGLKKNSFGLLRCQGYFVENFYSKNNKKFEISEASKDLDTEYLKQDTITKKLIKKKILELAVYYNHQSILALTNLIGDFVTFLVIILLIIYMKPQISILKSFLTESIYSLNDTKKSFLLILGIDLLVGFHSPRGWEICLELLLRHFGFPENKDFVFLFVASFPVLLDTVFKYWIFRYLNKISPSTVATYHSMIE